MTNLIYIADPMCSWCYGFGPELSALMAGLPEVPVEIIVGGLRAYHQEPITEQQKEKLLAYWGQVHETTGLPFNNEMLERPGFVYNTEPACRAVVTARMIAPHAALTVLQAIQQAFYADGRDVTNGEVLAEISAATLTAAGVPTDASDFLAKWAGEQAVLATHADFEQTKKWEVSGFPTLVLERNGELQLVTAGLVQMPLLVEKLQAIVDQQDGQPE
jgi:putative protein-disulfide isomerase